MDDQIETINETNKNIMKISETLPVKTGEQTQITPKVQEVAKTINGEGVIAIMNIANHIKSMEVVEDAKEPDFSRSADQILIDNKYNGCNEAGVVFASLLRAKGIPTEYIQALDKTAIENYPTEHNLKGHVFLEAELDDKKTIINSTTGEISESLPNNFVIGGRGLDSWDIGLKHGGQDLQKLFEKRFK